MWSLRPLIILGVIALSVSNFSGGPARGDDARYRVISLTNELGSSPYRFEKLDPKAVEDNLRKANEILRLAPESPAGAYALMKIVEAEAARGNEVEALRAMAKLGRLYLDHNKPYEAALHLSMANLHFAQMFIHKNPKFASQFVAFALMPDRYKAWADAEEKRPVGLETILPASCEGALLLGELKAPKETAFRFMDDCIQGMGPASYESAVEEKRRVSLGLADLYKDAAQRAKWAKLLDAVSAVITRYPRIDTVGTTLADTMVAEGQQSLKRAEMIRPVSATLAYAYERAGYWGINYGQNLTRMTEAAQQRKRDYERESAARAAEIGDMLGDFVGSAFDVYSATQGGSGSSSNSAPGDSGNAKPCLGDNQPGKYSPSGASWNVETRKCVSE